jgi:hypothetical protein
VRNGRFRAVRLVWYVTRRPLSREAVKGASDPARSGVTQVTLVSKFETT